MYRQRLFRLFLLLLAATLLGACHKEQVIPQNARGIYFWRTTLRLSAFEKQFLQHHHITRLFCRYFDMVVNPAGNVVPNATLIFRESVPMGIEIVPTVYITEACLHRNLQGIASKLVERILQMNLTNDIAGVKEIQIDCDYTQRSLPRYTEFLKEVQQELARHDMTLSVTIRLHQLSMPAPPAHYGVLMMYNTGNFRKLTDHNPILDIRDVKPYLHNLASYPLPLCGAYPLYRWTLYYNRGQFQRIVRGPVFQGSEALEHKGPGMPVMRFEGDSVVTWKSDIHKTIEIKQLLERESRTFGAQKLCFHLSENELSQYSFQEIEKLYAE